MPETFEYRCVQVRLIYPDGRRTKMHHPGLEPSEDAESISWAFGYARHHGCKVAGAAIGRYASPEYEFQAERILVVPEDIREARP